jgi:hypothetical protein
MPCLNRCKVLSLSVMIKKLLINLLCTFLLATVIDVAVFYISYYFDESFVRAGLDVSARGFWQVFIILNLLFLLSSAPSLLLLIRRIRNNVIPRRLVYFSAPVFVLLTCTFVFTGNDLSFNIVIWGSAACFIFIYIALFRNLAGKFYLNAKDFA